jgi:hypothetical protein
MQRKILITLCIAAMPLAFLTKPAFSDNGVSLNITNDGTDDIEVTVYDTTLGPKAVVLAHARVNGFTTIPLSVAADDTGRGNISWTAVTADKNDRKCGHADNIGLGDSAAVKVRADSDCATISASTT